LDQLKSELQIAADNLITTPLVGLEALKENFKNFQLPSSPTEYQEYYNLLQQKVFPYIINTGSPQFIGHMTSVLPAFIYELGKLVSMLNQNVVKIETSKALTLLEREIIAVVHNRFFNKDKGFYELHIQDPMSNLGSVASNGTISNITALWAARNNSFPPDGTFKGVAEEGINAALKYYKYEDSIILVSPFLHYSFEKAASLLGVGKKSIHYLPITQSGVVDILALEKCINSYRAQRKHILAIIGIAGATETGFIDPLLEIGEIAKSFMIHYHVDAAFGGSLIFSDKHKHLLKGIEYADTITVCGHKQLYVPMGLSLCIFSDPKIAHAIYNTADYQSIINSFDFGKVTLEGSRPSASLLLHAVLNIFGKTGFEHLITLGIRNARYFRDRILQSNNFELVVEPHINIVNYRYIPKQFRKKIQLMKLSSEDNKLIDEANILLQTTQFNQGKTFISKTTIPCSKYSEEIVTLRAVFSNPLTTPDDINQVLNDQLKIATTAIEHEEIEEQIDTLSVNSNELNISVPIGRPIINTTLYVLDRDLKPLPLGVIGELYVGGVGLARGYLNKPELTAERFIGNPFQTKEEKVDESYGPNGRNARLYKTGDLVRWLPDGNIEYIERSDFQVKIRGYRVELGEIENSLSNFEGVKQAVVLAREHHRAKYLVGYYVADSKLDEAEILRYLQSKLPEYMVPSTLVHLEKLLLTINGKLDRKALPEPEFTSSADYMGPRNEIERQVCRIWAEVLRFPENKLGIQDDFFRLGGNSILAMKLVSKINKALKANIDIAGVFEARTISRLINNYIVTKKDNYLIGEEYEF
jgi:putative pyridoxal-dependent aspartate 1-decarboxylase